MFVVVLVVFFPVLFPDVPEVFFFVLLPDDLLPLLCEPVADFGLALEVSFFFDLSDGDELAAGLADPGAGVAGCFPTVTYCGEALYALVLTCTLSVCTPLTLMIFQSFAL